MSVGTKASELRELGDEELLAKSSAKPRKNCSTSASRRRLGSSITMAV